MTWKPVPAEQSVLRRRPVVDRDLYRCAVDGHFLWKKFHLSGLLLLRTMDNWHTRAVFSNEMGFTFFDFEWNERDSFRVNQVIPQLDKPAVIRTLKKDFSLLLMKGLDRSSEVQAKGGSAVAIHRFTLDKGYAYYETKPGALLCGIDNAGKSRVTSIDLEMTGTQLPDTIVIRHHKAHFTIDLRKIEPHAAE